MTFPERKLYFLQPPVAAMSGRQAEKLKPYLSAGAEIAGAEVLNQNPSLEELKQWAVW